MVVKILLLKYFLKKVNFFFFYHQTSPMSMPCGQAFGLQYLSGGALLKL